MNTGKQINAMVVVLFITLIALGAYTIFDPFRSDAAKDEQQYLAAERGANTFALNCRLCHGDRGQGGADGGRLGVALPLDSPELQGISGGTFSETAFDEAFDLVTNTIMCGRVGAQMPAWAESQGGTLNDEQIRQLAVLITEGEWELAQEHADELDAEATGHAHVEMPDGTFSPTDTELIVSNARAFSLGQHIRIKVDEETEERMRILPRQLVVDRGVDGTEADSHDEGVEVFIDGQDEAASTIGEEFDDEATGLVVLTPDDFEVGDTLIIEDERLEVVDIIQGLPTTGLALTEEIGRTPKTIRVSGFEGLEVGQTFRMDGEVLEIESIEQDGDPGIEIVSAVAAGDDTIAVDEPTFFRAGYTFRIGDEWVRVIDPVDTGEVLFDTVGRAENTIFISGTAGIQQGMVIRMGDELMRVAEIVQPARIEVERGADETTPGVHAAGSAISELLDPPEDDPEAAPEFEDTEQSVLTDTEAEATTIAISSTNGVPIDTIVEIDGERMLVIDLLPAEVRVERALDGTEKAPHARRAPIFESNLLEVERGVAGSTAAAHEAGDEIFLTELQVKRSVEGSDLEAHAKNAELFLGNNLIVQRGLLGTEPAEHQNGSLIYDFPLAPEGPPITMAACGQSAASLGGPAEPEETPIPDGVDVDVALSEWLVEPDPASAAAGGVNFTVINEGTGGHNFRVLRTDLAADALSVVDGAVNEAAAGIEVVGGFQATIAADAERLSAIVLEAGNYVLICNVPDHYTEGMRVAFEVTP